LGATSDLLHVGLSGLQRETAVPSLVIDLRVFDSYNTTRRDNTEIWMGVSTLFRDAADRKVRNGPAKRPEVGKLTLFLFG
jgi:hypothetical protein